MNALNRDDLILQNQGLVRYVAHKFPNARYYGHSWDDLISIGNIGLVKAANAFKPDRGIKFATFAIQCIKNEILMTIRRKQPFTVSLEAVTHYDAEEDSHHLTLETLLSVDADYSGGGVTEFIRQLPKREREILRMRMRGDGQKAISRKLKISQSYVSRLLHRMGREYLVM